ncbi:MBOAT family O-acyltransferase [Paenibacillus sp. LHD-117]|uniref:MBOAT family O-acyltransferase n=1 Tax=Paenibacillus sp. LHD-117 TaxID=3071412 RepID=UPI0027E063DE|nr:MBOAT family O-acyltransferase [Paenibacillus sp. LHD-117]MDQ6418031.1 MBOAT family O-acyltransferase [Paenibacillus sp. LHD-117]
MIFSTYTFIFVFLPVTLLGYRILGSLGWKNAAKLWLVLASIAFYAKGSGTFVFLFIVDILLNFAIGNLIAKADKAGAIWRKRLLLTIGIALNIGFLGYYKYANFAIENLNLLSGGAFPLLEIALPLGISFYTFQLIAFLVDCYRGRTKETPIIDFLTFITFFPQLIVGPIVHHEDMIPQYRERNFLRFNGTNMMLGIFLFSMGCAKKIMLADPLTGYAASFYANVGAGDTFTSWVASLGYSISYYFDLSGYADMALGLALMFNIRLPHNFNSPYKARNFREYWQRWHMTLSKFLSDYVFRSFYRKGSGSFNFYFSVMMTFFVSGFWHGAGWQFIIWGLINGVFVCMSHMMYRNKWQLPFALAWTLTFAGVVGTRILFVSDDMPEAWAVFRKMFSLQDFAGMGFGGFLEQATIYAANHAYIVALLLIGMAISFFAPNSSQLTNDFQPRIRHAVAAAFMLGISLAQMTSVSNFLYFQF